MGETLDTKGGNGQTDLTIIRINDDLITKWDR